MSTQASYTIDGLPPRGRTRPGGGGRGRLGTLCLGLLVLGLVVFHVVLWMAGSGRSQAAIRKVKADAEAYRASWAASRPETPPGGKAAGRKKGTKKKKNAPTVGPTGPFAVAPLSTGKVPLAELKQQNQELEGELAGLMPKGVYIVIDTANNRFYMKKGPDTVLNAQCSTGSYTRLEAADGRAWFFHTPRGLFQVESKKKDPVWVKPDWAFVEEQEPIPGARDPDRYEPYVMGDYALGFGHGYYIHGTLYRRLLGQSVTHGCVRLGDHELEQVYRTAELGTPIFIY